MFKRNYFYSIQIHNLFQIVEFQVNGSSSKMRSESFNRLNLNFVSWFLYTENPTRIQQVKITSSTTPTILLADDPDPFLFSKSRPIMVINSFY